MNQFNDDYENIRTEVMEWILDQYPDVSKRPFVQDYKIDDALAIEVLDTVADSFNAEMLVAAVKTKYPRTTWTIAFLALIAQCNEDTFNCDHCGKLEYVYHLTDKAEVNSGATITQVEVIYGCNSVEVDLCDDCYASLEFLIRRGKR